MSVNGLMRATRWVFGAAFAWCLFVILCGLLNMSCATVPVVPAVVVTGCQLTAAPPLPPHLAPGVNCATNYAFCLTVEDSRAMLLWVKGVKAWDEDAWLKCQKFPPDAK